MTSATTVNLTFANPGGATTPANPLNIAINYTGTTQYGSPYAFKGTPDGYTSGEFRGISINPDGSLMAGYTNGQNANVGTIVLADFANLQGLQPIGNNAWKETGASGQPILGQPGNNGLSRWWARRPRPQCGHEQGTGQHDHRAAHLPGELADDQDPERNHAGLMNIK